MLVVILMCHSPTRPQFVELETTFLGNGRFGKLFLNFLSLRLPGSRFTSLQFAAAAQELDFRIEADLHEQCHKLPGKRYSDLFCRFSIPPDRAGGECAKVLEFS